MDELVQDVLQSSSKQSKYKPTTVTKDIELDIDEGNLLASDSNPLNLKEFRTRKENYFKSLARDNVQILVNKIWELPVERSDEVIIVKLPDPRVVVPREKPLPKEKPKTKWDQYAQLKSITKRKKGRMVWDDTSKEWRPRWGYKRANDDTKEWLLEVPQTADPYEDQFAKKMKAKKERVAKNELQRLRNIARNMKGKVPGVGLTPTEAPDKDHVSQALNQAKKSTASMGVFTRNLPAEKAPKNTGKKRKFEPTTGDLSKEKQRVLNVLNKVQKGTPTLDANHAANQIIHEQERRSAENNRMGQGNKAGGRPQGRGKGKGKGGGKGGPKGGGSKGKKFGGPKQGKVGKSFGAGKPGKKRKGRN